MICSGVLAVKASYCGAALDDLHVGGVRILQFRVLHFTPFPTSVTADGNSPTETYNWDRELSVFM